MSRSAGFWGLLLVILGSLFLLDNLNIISINLWQLAGPAFLILLGIWVLLAPGARGKKAVEYNLLLDGSSDADVRLSFGAGRLQVGSGAGGENLVEGKFVGGVNDKTRHQGDTLFVNLDMPSFSFPVMPFFPGFEPMTWDIKLNNEISLRLDLSVGAADSKIDLSNLHVSSLRLSTGVSSTALTLPANAGFTKAIIKSGVASVDVIVPEGVVASIHATAGLGTIQVNRNRFPRIGSKYESSDYHDADNKIELAVETGLGSVNIR